MDVVNRVKDFGNYARSIQKNVHSYRKGDLATNEVSAVLTDADILVQEGLLRDFLERGYEFSIFAEEESPYLEKFPEEKSTLVTLDPIDGTLAYKLGLPNFCTVLSVYEKGKLEGTLVNAPCYQKTYVAVNGKSEEWGADGREKYIFSDKSNNKILSWGLPDEMEHKFSEFELIQLDKKEKRDPKINISSIFRGEICAYFRKNAPCLDWGPMSLIMENSGKIVTDYNGNTKDIHQHFQRTDGFIDSRIPSIIVSGDEEVHKKLVDILSE